MHITAAGYETLRTHIAGMEMNLRQLIRQKGEAAEVGGNAWHDNFSFEQIEREERMLRTQIADMRALFDRVRIVSVPENPTSVEVGVAAEIRFDGEDEAEVFHLVGVTEGDPDMGRVSYQSPLGAALLGARPGDERTFKQPDGHISRFIVLRIRTGEGTE